MDWVTQWWSLACRGISLVQPLLQWGGLNTEGWAPGTVVGCFWARLQAVGRGGRARSYSPPSHCSPSGTTVCGSLIAPEFPPEMASWKCLWGLGWGFIHPAGQRCALSKQLWRLARHGLVRSRSEAAAPRPASTLLPSTLAQSSWGCPFYSWPPQQRSLMALICPFIPSFIYNTRGGYLQSDEGGA